MADNPQIEQISNEPLLAVRFVVFLSVYMAVTALAAVIVFYWTSLPLGTAFAVVACARLAVAVFGRVGVKASVQFVYESALLVIAGLPAGFIAGCAGGIPVFKMLALELLIIGAFILSGAVAVLKENSRWRVDLLYTGFALAFCFGAPLVWFQAAQYGGARWDFLLAFSPFYHAAVVPGPSVGRTLIFALLIAALGVAVYIRARTSGRFAGEGTQ